MCTIHVTCLLTSNYLYSYPMCNPKFLDNESILLTLYLFDAIAMHFVCLNEEDLN